LVVVARVVQVVETSGLTGQILFSAQQLQPVAAAARQGEI
jgi:hypothetical protein